MSGSIYDIEVTEIHGERYALRKHAGKVLLVVNVASKCGLTPQYRGLQALHERFSGKGLAVLGFPCNQFGAQEPGSEAEVAEFCQLTFGVTFSMHAKVLVNGDGAHPLYNHLKSHGPGENSSGPVQWNFEKFLVGRDGEVIARFPPTTSPESLIEALERALG